MSSQITTILFQNQAIGTLAFPVLSYVEWKINKYYYSQDMYGLSNPHHINLNVLDETTMVLICVAVKHVDYSLDVP